MKHIDFIGDIHGHATALKALLEKMGYSLTDGVWSHPSRKACFLGDYIDRGDEQAETIDVVKNMVEGRAAYAIMGNHELNAIGWVTASDKANSDSAEQWLRPHSAKNLHQHSAFLDQIGENSEQHHQAVQWFATLPLWVDFGDIRVAHACWHEPSMRLLKPYLDESNCLKPGSMPSIYANEQLLAALEVITKGMETDLPKGYSFPDKDGHIRTSTRLKWWSSEKMTYQQAAVIAEKDRANIPDIPLEVELGYKDNIPVLFGHYWMSGTPAALTKTTACLDYSIAAKGAKDRKLCAYRWDGEKELNNDHFVWVEG